MISFEIEELMPVLTKLTAKYTSNESSSVSYEKAKQLMEAIFFCIQELEKNNPIDDTVMDKNLSPEDCYQMGYQLVVKKVQSAMKRYHAISSQFKWYGNLALHDTILKGMPKFFQYYDPLFAPQNQILTLDYPTLVPVQELKGIDAIYQYLVYVEMEQHFLRVFPEEYVENALECYHPEHEELFINIPSVVLQHLIYEQFQEELAERIKEGRESLEVFLSGIIRVFVREKLQDDKLMYGYLKNGIKDFVFRINES